MEKSNSPKLSFYYCLSLVTLLIGSISFGTIVFEIINKVFPLISENSYGNDSGLKAAISGIVIAFPIFYFITSLIYKGIINKEFDIESGARKWLTYFIIFISSVVMIGSLIGLLNNFLDGETTSNFILKTLTVLGVSSAIFTFYFNDIKRKEISKKFNKIYFFTSLILVIIALVSSFFIVESPIEARNRKTDQGIINNLETTKRAIEQYYNEKGKLPQNLDEIKNENYEYINTQEFTEQSTGKYYTYQVIEGKKYELCANFKSSNIKEGNQNDYYMLTWKHDKGYQCITKRIEDASIKAIPAP